MKNKKLIIGATALIGLGLILVFKYIKNNPKANETFSPSDLSNPSETAPRPDGTTTAVKKLNSTSFPLKKGSNGFEVQVVQKWLNDNGYASPKLVEDGVFGVKTETAINAMQTNPYSKDIVDYINSYTKKLQIFPKGIVDKDFYDIFIGKTKKMIKGIDIGIQF